MQERGGADCAPADAWRSSVAGARVGWAMTLPSAQERPFLGRRACRSPGGDRVLRCVRSPAVEGRPAMRSVTGSRSSEAAFLARLRQGEAVPPRATRARSRGGAPDSPPSPAKRSSARTSDAHGLPCSCCPRPAGVASRGARRLSRLSGRRRVLRLGLVGSVGRGLRATLRGLPAVAKLGVFGSQRAVDRLEDLQPAQRGGVLAHVGVGVGKFQREPVLLLAVLRLVGGAGATNGEFRYLREVGLPAR